MCSHALRSAEARLACAAAPGLLRAPHRDAPRRRAGRRRAREDAHEVAPLQLEAIALALRQLVSFDFDCDHRRAPVRTPCRPRSVSALALPACTAADDARIGAAPADVAIHEARDVLIGGIRVSAQQADRGHDHAGRAVAALERFGFEERFLHRVQPLAVGDGFDGRDRLPRSSAPTRVHERRRPGCRARTVQAPQCPSPQPNLPRQLEVVAQDRQQAVVGLPLDLVCSAVHPKENSSPSGESTPVESTRTPLA